MSSLQTSQQLEHSVAARRLKVAHITTVHSARDPRIFHKECRSLARAGFDVTVIGPHPSDAMLDDVRIKSIRQDGQRALRMTRTAWRAYQAARRENADIYHFHDPELLPVGWLLSAKGKGVIYDAHEDLPKDVLSKHYLPEWTRGFIAWTVSRIEETLSKKFSAIVAVTPAIAERLGSTNPRTVVVHNYPYAEDLLHQETLPAWNDRRHSVAYVGGITVQRAIREMVSAMALLPGALPATLELAGPELPQEADSDAIRRNPGWTRVRHHGFLDQPSTFRLLRSVRAGLVLFHPEPSHIESMPQKIFEYMGAGLPVIASDFPLWRKIIGGARCGIFVDPQNPAQIASAIEYTLTHPREAEEMGQRGRSAVTEKFNWKFEAIKLVNLYLEVGNSICVA